MTPPVLHVDASIAEAGLRFALVWGGDLSAIAAGDGPPSELQGLVDRIRSTGVAPWPESRRDQVRRMLRHGKYRASGRGKPASEFLLGAALDGTFPLLNGSANANNCVSLESGLPASVFDADVTGEELLVRWGKKGEGYVFNPSGQTIDVEDLLCVCRRESGRWVPTGNPVKDSMASKITASTKNAVGVIYAPAECSTAELAAHADRFASLLSRWAGAAQAAYRIA